MPHTKGAARTKHKAECKAYKEARTAERNKAHKAAKRTKRLAKAKARRERKGDVIAAQVLDTAPLREQVYT